MVENLPQKYLAGVWLLRGLLNESSGNDEEAQKDLGNARNFDPNSKTYLEKNEPVALSVFPAMSRLCTIFPWIELRFGKRSVLVIISGNQPVDRRHDPRSVFPS